MDVLLFPVDKAVIKHESENVLRNSWRLEVEQDKERCCFFLLWLIEQ